VGWISAFPRANRALNHIDLTRGSPLFSCKSLKARQSAFGARQKVSVHCEHDHKNQ